MSSDEGERVERPPGSGPTWCVPALTQLRRQEMGDIAIHLETNQGDVFGHLDRVSTVLGTIGTIALSDGQKVNCDDVHAYTVIVED